MGHGAHSDWRNKELFTHVCELCQNVRFGNLEHDLTECELLREIDALELDDPSYKPYFLLDNYFFKAHALEEEDNEKKKPAEDENGKMNQAEEKPENANKYSCGALIDL